MTWQTEFTDFPADAMPQIPKGFVDAAWRNDSCPGFFNPHLELKVWVDYPNPEDRVVVEAPQFSLHSAPADAEGLQVDEGEVLWAGDEWRECLAQILARAFAHQLALNIDESQRLEVRELLKLPEYMGTGVCPTHNFCDANMVMLDAWQTLFDRDPAFLENPDSDNGDMEIWDAAWEPGVELWVAAAVNPMDVAAEVIADLMNELESAAATFDRYGMLHREKATPEGDEKAAANFAHAKHLHNTVAAAKATIQRLK